MFRTQLSRIQSGPSSLLHFPSILWAPPTHCTYKVDSFDSLSTFIFLALSLLCFCLRTPSCSLQIFQNISLSIAPPLLGFFAATFGYSWMLSWLALTNIVALCVAQIVIFVDSTQRKGLNASAAQRAAESKPKSIGP